MSQLEYFYCTILSNYITNKTDFINLMTVNKKFGKLNKWYRQINSPFVDNKLFPNNQGPKENNWDIIYITNNNKIKTRLNYGENISKIKQCYLHSKHDPLAVSSRYKELPSIIIPSNKILSDMFRFNFHHNLKELVLPSTLKEIHGQFQHCPVLTKVVIPTSVKTISHAFYHCDALMEITIPSSVTLIEHSFTFNLNLTELNVDSRNVILIESINNNYNLRSIEFSKKGMLVLKGPRKSLDSNHPEMKITCEEDE